jgi:peptide/nickel transport system substrate-binding protein
LGTGLESNCAISPLYNQVVEFNPVKPDEIIGDLAKSWESGEDGLSFTFILHDNAKWTDGEPITAEDAAFSVNRMIEPGEPRPRVGLLRAATKDAEALGPYTLKVNLKFASAAFLPFLAVDYMKVVPKHVIEAGIDINEHPNIVSGGPFMPNDDRRGSFWRHAKNPDYFKEDRPFFDSLTMNNILDPGTIVAAFETGAVDWTAMAPRLSVEDALAIEQNLKGKYTVHWTVANLAIWVNVNTEKDPWSDLRVIQALRLATDQTELQQGVGAGRYLVGAPFPTNSWYGHTEEELAELPGYGGMPGSTRTKQDDIDDAIALLKEAGYDPPSMLGKRVIQTAPVLWFSDLVQLWAQQMRRNLGLEMETKIIDINTHVQGMISGEFDMALWGYGVNIADPDDYVQSVYMGGARNYTNHVDPELQELFDKQSIEANPVERQKILRQMESLLLEGQRDANILIEWATNFNVMSDRVRTEVGAYVPPLTIQTILKWEHMWFEE